MRGEREGREGGREKEKRKKRKKREKKEKQENRRKRLDTIRIMCLPSDWLLLVQPILKEIHTVAPVVKKVVSKSTMEQCAMRIIVSVQTNNEHLPLY